ncbi:MAG: YchJ family metal-binding protein [Enhygromyxa sp.]
MAGRSPTAPCPCGSGRTYKRCCRRFHQGQPALTPEALMRSRYSAYAVGAVDYLIATTDPAGPQFRPDRAAWADEIALFCQRTRFEKLTIQQASGDNDHGEVRFFARLSRDGEDVSFTEHSRFTRVEDRWLYHSGALE